MVPDPLRLAIALAPLAAYLGLLSAINARRRPFVTTGGSDLATLGMAMSGMVLVGPIELFRPSAATVEVGRYVWLFLLGLYLLCVWMAALVSRPRLVVYNISCEELRPVLAEAARRLDPQSRWAGDNLAMPSLGVSLHMECFDVMRHASLIASGGRQDLAGWQRLSSSLRTQLAALRVATNPRWLGLLLGATLLLVLSILPMVGAPDRVAQALDEMLHF